MSGASFTYFCENTCFEAVCCVLGEHAEKELSDPVTEECFKFKKKAVGHLSWSWHGWWIFDPRSAKCLDEDDDPVSGIERRVLSRFLAAHLYRYPQPKPLEVKTQGLIMAGNFMLLLRVIKEECERVTHRGVTCPTPPTQTLNRNSENTGTPSHCQGCDVTHGYRKEG